jgi:hypothetical protein
MSGPSRQVPDVDVNTLNLLLSVIWFIIVLGLVFWFYAAIKRIERALEDIKRELEGKA